MIGTHLDVVSIREVVEEQHVGAMSYNSARMSVDLCWNALRGLAGSKKERMPGVNAIRRLLGCIQSRPEHLCLALNLRI
jgi:hypothetical protein